MGIFKHPTIYPKISLTYYQRQRMRSKNFNFLSCWKFFPFLWTRKLRK